MPPNHNHYYHINSYTIHTYLVPPFPHELPLLIILPTTI
jgi:hypothetical protein